MLLADQGAEVIRVEPSIAGRSGGNPKNDVTRRNRKNIVINLKEPKGVEALKKLCETADILLEGFRPGVIEKLGVGPDVLLNINPKIVVGRMTGWGQTGPLSKAAGHDINYISLSGALHAIGRKGEKPVPPLNLVGDFGGGSMFLAYGVLCAYIEAQKSGKGQVVDAAMTEGSAALLASLFGMASTGGWAEERGTNLLDTGAHFYDAYECKDGKHISIGSIEGKFYDDLLKLGGMLDIPELSRKEQFNQKDWQNKKRIVERVFKTKTQKEWCDLMEGSDVCFAPILSMWDAPKHPHAKARESFYDIDGITHPAPAPKFSRTPSSKPVPSPQTGAHTIEILSDLGYNQSDIDTMLKNGAVAQAKGSSL